MPPLRAFGTPFSVPNDKLFSQRPASGSGIGTSANGKWPHDLHHKVNASTSRVSKLPTTISPAVARSLQNNRLFAALHGPSSGAASFAPPTGPKHNSGISIRGSSTGLSIKGSAGPYVVEAANFAPGTTAEDVKMAMVPLGKILSCIVLSASPWVTCEIVFETKQAAENCLAQYHNQLADGMVSTFPPGCYFRHALIGHHRATSFCYPKTWATCQQARKLRQHRTTRAAVPHRPKRCARGSRPPAQTSKC